MTGVTCAGGRDTKVGACWVLTWGQQRSREAQRGHQGRGQGAGAARERADTHGHSRRPCDPDHCLQRGNTRGQPAGTQTSTEEPLPSCEAGWRQVRFSCVALFSIRREITTKYLSAVAPVNEYYQAAHRSQQERERRPRTLTSLPCAAPTSSLLCPPFPSKLLYY